MVLFPLRDAPLVPSLRSSRLHTLERSAVPQHPRALLGNKANVDLNSRNCAHHLRVPAPMAAETMPPSPQPAQPAA